MAQLRSIFSLCAVAVLWALTFCWLMPIAPTSHAHGAEQAAGDTATPAPSPTPHPYSQKYTPPQPPAPYDDIMDARFGKIKVISSAVDVEDPAQLARLLAMAMDINPNDLHAASLMCDVVTGRCTNPAAVAVLENAPGTWFPTLGYDFAMMSTGPIELGVEPDYNLSELDIARLENLKALTDSVGNDAVRLHLTLNVPQDAHCLSFDYTFYTADLRIIDDPQQYDHGDFFAAQFNSSNYTVNRPYSVTTVDALGNFAKLKPDGDMIAISTMSPYTILRSLQITVGMSIPGVFPLLQARHRVSGGERIDLYLSMQDVHDSRGNSAVALDNFAWITDTDATDHDDNDCETGISGDSDGDGLPNGWEEYGVHRRDPTGKMTHLKLHKLGADPNVKDIFVEIDTMKPLTKHGYDPKPISDSIAMIVNAFDAALVKRENSPAYEGIQLHVDFGPDAPLYGGMNEDGEPNWGGLSDGKQVTPHEYLCPAFRDEDPDHICDFSDTGIPFFTGIFSEIKAANFAAVRLPVFHYALFAHHVARCDGDILHYFHSKRDDCNNVMVMSGMSNNHLPLKFGASDFVVTLAHDNWQKPASGPITYIQAGTFMHELGHNLGLNHYGTREDMPRITHKPNHLSVMNYRYQTKGLVVSERPYLFDYLRYYSMTTLHEEYLHEEYLPEKGFSVFDPEVSPEIGLEYTCKRTKTITVYGEDRHKINWNCKDSITSGTVTESISGDFDEFPDPPQPILDKLPVEEEWNRLTFTGGYLYRQRSLLGFPVLMIPGYCGSPGNRNPCRILPPGSGSMWTGGTQPEPWPRTEFELPPEREDGPIVRIRYPNAIDNRNVIIEEIPPLHWESPEEMPR